MPYSLNEDLAKVSKLSKDHAAGLKHLKLQTVRDLLFYFPTRYADAREVVPIDTLIPGNPVTLYGVMEKVTVRRSFKGHIPMTEARVADNSGVLRCVWFNQAYIGKMYPEGARVKVSGIVQQDKNGLCLTNPTIDHAPLVAPEGEQSLFGKDIQGEFLIPVYRETKGVSSLFLYTLIKRIVASGTLEEVEDPVPNHITSKLHLPELKDALLYIHFPKNEQLTIAARKRFAFEEIFYLQIKQQLERAEAKGSLAYPISQSDSLIQDFIKRFSFTPTNSQLDAIKGILKDMAGKNPMGRLLEGDVGSGKTFVASVAAYATINTRVGKTGTAMQVAYMAPTEILAKQHFESFIKFFEGTNIEIGLLTGSGCKKFPSKLDPEGYTDISRAQLLKWIADGRMSVIVGTHALIQKSVIFKDLALVIIDEQHRFGVKQRKALAHKKGEENKKTKKELPHLLSMTATPIPRTLALSMFGDLDLTVIDEMPLERKRIITEIIKPSGRKKVEDAIARELESGRQAYVICPRIDEQDEEERQKRQLKSVKEEAKRLKEKVFPNARIEILHSKMKITDKEDIMARMLAHEIDILVATSVVEVGVNIQNATAIIIEGAERFGLAQLHQLRGRVGRSSYQSYCYLFTESTADNTLARLKALVDAKNGFELAELDMMQRGIGTLMDGKQWGVSDLAMEAIRNPKLVEIAREEAKTLVEEDPTLENFPELGAVIKERAKVHME
jgi:ATP-dependent DNA helicase RecG